ncbi:MAG: glycine cleavage system aminomethyltransferase GcvT [Saprospiraceae bacterium]|nr:glycine cleavage system aminomethyltransferase GcvT [Saprospiraceae bacterium]
MKETALTERHIALGAKMAEFAGYHMPISYTGIKEEHEAVRNFAGIFDVSHMGEFIVKGKQALDLVQKVSSNDASKLNPGEAQYSCLPRPDGGIVDDLLVYRLFDDQCAEGEQAFMLVVNASNIQKDWDWISSFNTFDTRLIDISDKTGLLAIQGPKVAELLQDYTDIDLKSIPYYQFRKGKFGGIDNVIISATGYTGAGGFELYLENENTAFIWDLLLKDLHPKGLLPVGLGARDTLRLEMGFCLYGNDIDDDTSPLEAGLGWITKLQKADFNGKEFLVNQKKNGLNKKLCGIWLEDRRVPRHGYKVLDLSEKEIGVVTSGTFSPSLNASIGLAYLPISMSKLETEILVNMGSKNLKAKVVGLPFYKG